MQTIKLYNAITAGNLPEVARLSQEGKMETMNLNKRFAELAGLCWHEEISRREQLSKCKCGYVYFTNDGFTKHCEDGNPDFIADPRLVLREMMKREDYKRFFIFVMPIMHVDGVIRWINSYILDTTGLLAKVAIKWLEKEGKG
jgi:hypothetical protein